MEHTTPLKAAVRFILPAVLVIGTAPAIHAQSLFVEGSAFASIDRRNTTVSLPAALGEPDPNTTVAGGGFSVGAWLTPSVTVRLEVGLPARASFSYESPVLPAIATTVGLRTVPTSSAEFSERMRTVAALLAFHTPRRRGVQLGYVGGAVFVIQTEHTRYSYFPYVLPVTVLDPAVILQGGTAFDTTSTAYNVTAAVGMDADIKIGGAFSAVPQVRLVGSNGVLMIRPGVALRASW